MNRESNRLTSADASFLVRESSTFLMHIAAVAVFDGSAPPYSELVAHVDSRLHMFPRLSQRLVIPPPLRGWPTWVDNPEFNLSYHVRHTAIPSPGSDQRLGALVARLVSTPMDRRWPLWELWLVEGFEDRFAVIVKAHHALLDGVSLLDLTSGLLGSRIEDPAKEIAAPENPKAIRAIVAGRGLESFVRGPAGAFGATRSLLRQPRSTLRASTEAVASVASTVEARLNGTPNHGLATPQSQHRRVAFVSWNLAEIAAIRRRYDATVNDIALACLALALCNYLNSREGVSPLLNVLIPKSVRSRSQPGTLGNQIAGMVAPLPVNLSDAEEAIIEVRDTMRRIKRSRQSSGIQLLATLGNWLPANVYGIALQATRAARPEDLVVTNVHGPDTPFFFLGRKAQHLYLIPTTDLAFNVGMTSYDGNFDFSLTTDYDGREDVSHLKSCLEEAIERLGGLVDRPDRESATTVGTIL
jgi:diacylglycerol O-acyltransferase